MYTRTTFRAKSKVNCRHSNINVGDWVFGSYIENTLDAPCIIFGDGEQIEVDKATLGQFIRYNEDNVPVFEYDLVQVDYVAPEESGSTYGVVYFCGNSFAYRVKDVFGEDDRLEDIGTNLWGNKFDNPDLFNELVRVFPDLQPAQ